MEGVKLTLALFFGRLLRSAIGDLQDPYILTILTTLTFTTPQKTDFLAIITYFLEDPLIAIIAWLSLSCIDDEVAI